MDSLRNCSGNADEDESFIVSVISCSVNVPTSLLATVGNILVLVSIWTTPSLHKPSHVLLFNLALSDMGVGLFVQPIFIFESVFRIRCLENFARKTNLVLRISGYYLSGVSLFTLTAISLDRYIAVRFHLRYREFVTVNRVISVIVLAWVALIANATSSLWCDCEFMLYLKSSEIFACLAITTFLYCRIYRVVRRHQSQIRANLPANQLDISQAKRSSWNMLLVYLVFIVCYLPYLIVKLMIAVIGQSAMNKVLYQITSLLVLVNSSLNPILYCWRMEDVREAVVANVRSFSRGLGRKAGN